MKFKEGGREKESLETFRDFSPGGDDVPPRPGQADYIQTMDGEWC